MNLIKSLQEFATRHFLGLLSARQAGRSTFRMLSTIEIDGETKPIFIAGAIDHGVEDGSISVVLNPDKELADELMGRDGRPTSQLTYFVAGRCDAGVSLWIDAYRHDGASLMERYQSRTIRPAKFVLR